MYWEYCFLKSHETFPDQTWYPSPVAYDDFVVSGWIGVDGRAWVDGWMLWMRAAQYRRSGWVLLAWL